MKGHVAIFKVRALRAGASGPETELRSVAVWVEGSLAVESPPTPVKQTELNIPVLAAISADQVAALVDDLDQ